MRFVLPVLFLAATIAWTAEPAKKKLSVTDQVTGMTVSVMKDDQTLEAKDGKSGKIVWKSNVINTAGKPNAGQPMIRDLTIKDGVVTVIYGKHSFAKFDLKSGRLLEAGSD